MAAFDFPASPTNGQTYSLNGVVFTYNGYGWVQQGNSGGVNTAYVDTQDALRVLKAGDTMSGDLAISKSTPIMYLNATNASEQSILYYQAGGKPKFMALTQANSGDYLIARSDDAGAFKDAPLLISRGSGHASFGIGTGFAASTTFNANSRIVNIQPAAVPDAIAVLDLAGNSTTGFPVGQVAFTNQANPAALQVCKELYERVKQLEEK
jgi:hypothetical protein